MRSPLASIAAACIASEKVAALDPPRSSDPTGLDGSLPRCSAEDVNPADAELPEREARDTVAVASGRSASLPAKAFRLEPGTLIDDKYRLEGILAVSRHSAWNDG